MPKSAELIADLTTGSVSRKLIKLSLPFMFSNLLQTLHSVIDMVIVGQYLGKVGMSAVSTASMLTSLVMLVCIGFSNGGQILIAQQVGAGNRDEMKTSIGTLSTVMILSSIVISILGVLLKNPLLHLLSTPEKSFLQAGQYLSTMFCGCIFIFGYNLVSAVFRGIGDSKHPLIFVGISTVVNIGLDFLFVAVFDWGVIGAAAATLIGYAAAFFCSVAYLYSHRAEIGFDFKLRSFIVERSCLGRLLRLALPLAAEMGIISISMLFVNKFVNQYDVTASAVFGAGTKIDEFSFTSGAGLMAGNTTMVAQNIGAGKIDRAVKSTHVTELILGIVTAVLVLLFALFPHEIYSIFTKDKEVIEMAPMFMYMLAFCTPGTLMMVAYQSFIEGIGNSRLSMTLAFLDGIVGRLSISFIGAKVLDMGLQGYFNGYGLAAYIYTILALIYFYSGKWRKYKTVKAALK